MTILPRRLRRAYSIWFGLPLLALGSTHRAGAAAPKWDPVSPTELAENTPRLEPEAPAEILNYRLEVDESIDGLRAFLYQLRIKIYDPSRATEVTRLARLWSGNSSTGSTNPYYEVYARLTLPDGTSRIFDEHDMRERSVAAEGRANGILGSLTSKSDWTVAEKFLAITGVEKGAVLDIWEREPKIEPTDWQMTSVQRTDMPIRKFAYSNRYVPNKKVLRRYFLLNPCGGQMTHDEKAGVMGFTAENLPSLRREVLAAPETYFSLTILRTKEYLDRSLGNHHLSVSLPDPVPLTRGPWAFFSTGRDYKDADLGFVSTRVKQKAAELVAGVTGDRDRIRKIYRYVQELYQRARHHVDFDYYGHYAKSLDELIDIDQSDPPFFREEDFHYLLVALVRAAGFECHTVYHPQRTAFPFRPEMVSEDFLNYWTIAVKVDGQWVLYDPTTDVPLSAGSLPWEIEGQPALMAMPQQQLFLKVPPAAAETSAAETTADLTLGLDGSLRGECVRTFTGHFAHTVRKRLRDTGQEKWWQLARSLLDLGNSSSEVRLVKIEGLDTPDEPVRIHATVHWPAYAEILQGQIIFPLAVWEEGRPPLLNTSTRTTPVFFHFSSVERESITVHLPANLQASALPGPITAKSGDFAYALAVTKGSEPGTLQVERTSVNRAIEIPVADYTQARDWFRRVSVADQIGIMLTRSAETPSK